MLLVTAVRMLILMRLGMRLLYLRRLGMRLRLRRWLWARLGSRLLRLLRMELGASLGLRARFRPWLRLGLRTRFWPWLCLRLRLRTEFLRTRFRLRLRVDFRRARRLLGCRLWRRWLMRYLACLLGLLLRVRLLLGLRMKLLPRLLRNGRITRLLRRTMLLRLPLRLLGHGRVLLRPGRLSTWLTLSIRALSCEGRLSGVLWAAVLITAGLRRTRYTILRLWPRIGHLRRHPRSRLFRSTLHAGYAGDRWSPAVPPGFDWPRCRLVIAARHRARRVRLDYPHVLRRHPRHAMRLTVVDVCRH
jgi:hypothetical protein